MILFSFIIKHAEKNHITPSYDYKQNTLFQIQHSQKMVACFSAGRLCEETVI